MPTMPLLQTVKQNAAAMTAPGGPEAAQTGLQPTGGDQTATTASLMGTAQTGKEATPALGQAKMSALGERLANLNTLMSAGALQQAGGMQSAAQQQQAEAQQQQTQGQMRLLSQEHLNSVESFNTQLSGIMQMKSDEIQRMVLADDRSKVEQVGLMLRLGNDKYLDQLNAEAERNRLDNQASFQNSLNLMVFAQESSLLGSSLQFRNYMQADKRQTLDQLASIDLDFALQIATADNKAAAATTMWSGIGTAAAAGASAAAGSGSQPQGDTNVVYSDAGTGGSVPESSAQNPAGYGTAPSSVDSSGNVSMPYTSPTPTAGPGYTPPGG